MEKKIQLYISLQSGDIYIKNGKQLSLAWKNKTDGLDTLEFIECCGGDINCIREFFSDVTHTPLTQIEKEVLVVC